MAVYMMEMIEVKKLKRREKFITKYRLKELTKVELLYINTIRTLPKQRD